MALVFALSGLPALAQTMTEADALRRLLAEDLRPEQFSEGFLAAVPLDVMRTILEDTLSVIGPPIDLRADEAGHATVITDTHRMDVTLSLDVAGRIAGLYLQPPVPRTGDLQTALAALETLRGTIGLTIRRDGAVLADRNADAPLLVASAFKLAVLAELADQIAAGRHDWADVVRLEDRHRTHPTGILQDYPDGSPLTLHTLAALMISQSDNTATDILIEVAGRDAVAARLGAEILPDVGDYFHLRADDALAARWIAADTDGRRAILAGLPATGLPPLPAGPVLPGLGWSASPARLCDLMEEVADIDVMGINPGLAWRADWAAIAYKGGSDLGVLSLVTGLTDTDGSRICVALVVNDTAPLPEDAVFAAYRGLLAALADT